MEKAYAAMALQAGLEMPKTTLIEIKVQKKNEAYFAVQRFDREVNRKIHFLSLSGYAYASHRVPCLDYGSGVFAATRKLTRSKHEVEKAFRLMIYNVLAHNKDDHAKNFAFLRDAASGQWKLSPAFDLTFNHGMANFHTTSINGAGNPTYSDIKKLATQFAVAGWEKILDEVRQAIAQWPVIASQYGVSKMRINEIAKAIKAIDRECARVMVPKSD
jgi:serine/threonine-protein kinase HipA